MAIRTFVITPENRERRLDIFLKKRLPDESRAFLQSLIRSGEVEVNGRKRKPDYPLNIGDHIELRVAEKTSRLEPEPSLDIPVIYEDDELLVINKPPRISTHPASLKGTGTVANWLIGHFPNIAGIGESPLRPGIVHRLDKGTSGVLIIPKTAEMFSYLKKLFKERKMKKEYTALVEGIPSPKKGVVEGYLSPTKKSYRKKKLSSLPLERSARPSFTRYEVTSIRHGVSTVKFLPETGRTHQIRVHAAALGNPILGDSLYGATRKLPEEFRGRFFLHASRLSFPFPRGEKKSFSAPLPSDFRGIRQWMSGDGLQ